MVVVVISSTSVARIKMGRDKANMREPGMIAQKKIGGMGGQVREARMRRRRRRRRKRM